MVVLRGWIERETLVGGVGPYDETSETSSIEIAELEAIADPAEIAEAREALLTE